MEYMPYFVSVLCALISGIVTNSVTRKQTKTEIDKLIKQHEFDLENMRENFKHQQEIKELEHKHQLEIQRNEFENKLGSDVMNTIIGEAMKNPEVQRQISQGMSNAGKKRYR